MNLLNLLSWSYLTESLPSGDFLFGYGLLVFFLGVLFSSSLFKTFGPKNKYFLKTLKKKFLWGKIFSGIGLFLVLVRFADVPYFSQRLWLLMVFLISVILFTRACLKVIFEYKKRMNSVAREKGKSL